MDEDRILAAIAALADEHREIRAQFMARLDRLERRLADMDDDARVTATLANVASRLRNGTRAELDLIEDMADNLQRQVSRLQIEVDAQKRRAA